MITAPRELFQTAWVVDDLDAAIAGWISRHAVGLFFRGTVALGDDGALRFEVALAQAGLGQVELILPHHSEHPLFANTGGLHHLGWLCRDVKRAAQVTGAPTLAQGRWGDSAYAYLDTRRELGVVTELLQHSPTLTMLFDRIAAASRNWDGSAPIRELAEIL